MILTYYYRIKPSVGQEATMLYTLELRLNKAWECWLFPDKSGKRGGRPRFKKPEELRSFVYPIVNCPKAGAHLNDRVLKLSKIGKIPVIQHRPIPDGFMLKTCTIVRKADGWYCCISMQDETVPTIDYAPY